MIFYRKHRYKPNLRVPISFNEKILNRKVHGNNLQMAFFADKLLVREFVKEKVGSKYLIPLLHYTDYLKFGDIEKLPKSFVVKTNHASGDEHISIVDDISNIDPYGLSLKFNNSIKKSYCLKSGELFYDYIPRKIIIEEYLDSGMLTPDDYKFHCFRGQEGKFTIYVQVDRGRFGEHYRNVYNEQWELQSLIFDDVPNFTDCKLPDNFPEMLDVVRKLATDFDYIRVDLYNIDGRIFFGELTQTPNNGMASFPREWDRLFGNLWVLNNKNEN